MGCSSDFPMDFHGLFYWMIRVEWCATYCNIFHGLFCGWFILLDDFGWMILLQHIATPRPKPHWEMITNHLDGDAVEAFNLSRDERASYELLSWVILPVTSTNSL